MKPRCLKMYLPVMLAVALMAHALSVRAVVKVTADSLTSPAITSSATLSVTGYQYPELVSSGSCDFQIEGATNKIILSIDHDQDTYMPSAIEANVSLSVVSYIYNGSLTTTTTTKTLTVKYDPDNAYQDQAIWVLDYGANTTGHKMDITVTGVTYSSGSACNLKLKAEIEEDFYTDLDPSTVPTLSSSYLSLSNELKFSWSNPSCEIEYFDLEWTWVDDYPASGSTPIAASALEISTDLFRHDATRVQIANTDPATATYTYSIPMLYDRGYILYRVRYVGKDLSGDLDNFIATAWSNAAFPSCTLVSCFTDRYAVSAHTPGLNWQGALSFAEEGKHKAAISYADGSNRVRQEVTKLNSRPGQTVVSETAYDRQGRPAINILPTPINYAIIAYNSDFNLTDATQAPLHWEDFDTDATDCLDADVSPELAVSSGAAQYYSSGNTFQEDLVTHRDLIPDADGYPYSHVEYTPDNTGKIRRQSGVGPDHKLGSGHDTRFYYGKPSQEELDRTFGFEAGLATHYLKDMTVDPNGQVSINYMDQGGNTVATTLAGETPDNMQSLGNTSTTVTTDLMNKSNPSDPSGRNNRRTQDGLSTVVTQNILVETEGAHSFDYELQAQSYSESCSTNTFCKDCVFDLEISLRDECGNEYLWRDDASVAVTETHVGPGPDPSEYSLSCTGANNVTLTNLTTNDGSASYTPVDLSVGSYMVNKRLTLNTDALNIYTDEYIEDMLAYGCLLTLDDFITDAKANIDFDCDDDCATCESKLDAHYNGSNTNPTLTSEEYNELLAECRALCEQGNPVCESAYRGMLTDMSPGGQYGQVAEGGSAVNGVIYPFGSLNETGPAQYPLSIYNVGNVLPRRDAHWNNATPRFPSWRKPYNPDAATGFKYEYLDADGNVDYVEIIDLGGGQYSPAILSAASPVTLSNGHLGIEPYNLASVLDFVYNWNPAWAQSLVVYHPEYAYYEMCSCLQPSHDFDEELLAMDYSEAETLFDFGNFATDLLTNASYGDPYFNGDLSSCTTSVGIALPGSLLMNYLMDNYQTIGGTTYSIYEVAHITANYPTYNATVFPSCTASLPSLPSINVGLNGCVNDNRTWDIFTGLYLSLKQGLQEQQAIRYAIANENYNGCFGVESFDFFLNDFFYTGMSTATQSFTATLWGTAPFNSQFFNIAQPCNYHFYELYRDKVPRFPTTNYMNQETTAATYQCQPEPALGNGYFTPNCTEKSEMIMEEQQLLGDISYYENCGQCPIAKDLEVFLSDIVTHADFTNTSTTLPLSCYPVTGVSGAWTSRLDAFFENILGGNPISWKPSSINSTTYDALFVVGSTTCSLELKTINNDPIDFSEIVEVCCLKTIDATHFTVNVKTYDTSTETYTDYVVKGTFGCAIDLASCDFDPICRTDKTGKQLVQLMNALVNNSDFDGSSVSLTSGVYPFLYGPELETYIGDAASWTGSLTSNVFQSIITSGSLSCTLSFTFPTSTTFSVSDLVKIVSVTPVHNSTNFELTAVFDNSGTWEVHTMTVTCPCITVGGCSNENRLALMAETNTDPLSIPRDCTPSSDATTLKTWLNSNFPSSGSVTGYTAGSYTIDITFHLPQQGAISVYDFTDVDEVLEVLPATPNGYEMVCFVRMDDGNVIKLTSTIACSGQTHNECISWGECVLQERELYSGTGHSNIPPANTSQVNLQGFVPFTEGMAAATVGSYPWDPLSQTSWLNESALWWVDLRDPVNNGAPSLNSGQNWNTNTGAHSQWTFSHLGDVFGVAFDQTYPHPNIYVTQSNEFRGQYSSGLTKAPLYGSVSSGAAGVIYKIDGETGNPTVFATLPQVTWVNAQNGGYGDLPGAGLGNICFDRDHQQLFATNFHDGRIYRIDLAGNILSTYDPFTQQSGSSVQRETASELVWGIAYDRDKVYFARWPHSNTAATIYSIELDADGEFTGSTYGSTEYYGNETLLATLQADKDLSSGSNATQHVPVSDLVIADNGRTIYATTRSSEYLASSSNVFGNVHKLTYTDASGWDESSAYYPLGDYQTHANAGGGVAYNHQENMVWASVGPYDLTCSSCSTGVNQGGFAGYDPQGYSLGGYPASGAAVADCYHTTQDYTGLFTSGTTSTEVNHMGDLEIFSFETKSDSLLCTLGSYPSYPYENDCQDYLDSMATSIGQAAYKEYIADVRRGFRSNYIDHCLDAYESFDMEYELFEYQKTLYYYDRAGNLVQTVPPEGIKDFDPTTNATELAAVAADRITGTRTADAETTHSFRTIYKYNSLDQLTASYMPDHEAFQEFTIATSTDIPTTVNLNANAAFTATDVIACGVDDNNDKIGYIYYSTNAGMNWTEAHYGNMPDMYQVMIDPGTTELVAAGEGGNVIRSTDNGATWWIDDSKTQHGANDRVFVSFLESGSGNGEYFTNDNKRWARSTGNLSTSNSGFAIGSGVTALHLLEQFSSGTYKLASYEDNSGGTTGDPGIRTWNGSTWTDATVKTLDLTQLIKAGGDYWAAGESGTLVRQNTGNNGWVEVPNNLHYDILDFHLTNANPASGCALVEMGSLTRLMHTQDGGTTWTEVTSIGGSNTVYTNYRDLDFYDATNGYAITADGKVLSSSDGGVTWSCLNSCNSIGASNTYTAIHSGASGTWLYAGTTDGKIRLLNSSGSSQGLSTAIGSGSAVQQIQQCTTSTNGHQVIALLADGSVHYQSDFGSSTLATGWSTVSGLSSATIYDMTFDLATNTGYLLSNTDVFKPTTSGNITAWSVLTSSPGTGYRCAIHNGTSSVFIAGLNGATKTTPLSSVSWSDHSNTAPPTIRDFTHLSANDFLACGDDGTLLSSTDGGATWTTISTSTSEHLNGLSSQLGTVVAVGTSGLSMVSSNSGSTWSTMPTGTPHDLYTVFHNGTEGAFYAGGAQGSIVRYVSSWSIPTASTSTETYRDAIEIASGDMVFCGTGGAIKRKTGSTWSDGIVRPPKMEDVVHTDATTAYAVGNQGFILKSTDAGATWNATDMNGNVLLGVDFANSTNGVTAGTASEVFYTVDAGATWSEVSGNPGGVWKDITMIDPTTIMLIHNTYHYVNNTTTNAMMRVTNVDATAQWTPVVAPFVTSCTTGFEDYHLREVIFPTPQVGYGRGSYGALIKSTDGGLNWQYIGFKSGTCNLWTVVHGLSSNLNVEDIHFTDEYNGYALLSSSENMLLTDDGGATWKLLPLGSSVIPNANMNTLIKEGLIQVVGDNGLVKNIYHNANGSAYSSRFYYDRVGRMVASQNAKQFSENPNQYSYSRYDAQSRIIESGQVIAAAPINSITADGQVDYSAFETWLAAGSTRSQVTTTHYDVTAYSGLPLTQENLRSRVASVTTEVVWDNDPDTYDNALHYSYDIHGNVHDLLHDIPALALAGHRFFKLEYDYDLISGKVNQLDFQENYLDQFYHRYAYDADNRLTAVQTSTDQHAWDRDAHYAYYDHGPLSRAELGRLQVQGLDYSYTLQGWLKGVNSNSLLRAHDPGQDGIDNSGTGGFVDHGAFAKDVFGYTLGYYHDNTAGTYDYTSIGTTAFEAGDVTEIYTSTGAQPLYNGNIATMATSLEPWVGVKADAGSSLSPMAKGYRYDQLNRLSRALTHDAFDSDRSTNDWASTTDTNDFKTFYTYDKNGNILTLDRWGDNAGGKMDEFTYHMESGTNRLNYVADAPSLASNFTTDIDAQASDNYLYDEIGNLVTDVDEGILHITWRADGKIAKITRGNDENDLEFRYNPMGDRIAKIDKPKTGANVDPESDWTVTWYIRDAQGNVLCTYDQSYEHQSGNNWETYLQRSEAMLYGSDRLGTRKPNSNEAEYVTMGDFSSTGFNSVTGVFESITVQGTNTLPFPYNGEYEHYTGQKDYELKNHLGNVLMTISDRRKAYEFDYTYAGPSSGDNFIYDGASAEGFADVSGSSTLTGDYTTGTLTGDNETFLAIITSASDYYPFGAQMPTRNMNPGDYRFGFNGQERDDEIKGTGNSYAFNLRLLDSRLGRWMSVDPLANKFAYYSPYHFAGNSPIVAIDLEGAEDLWIHYKRQEDGSLLKVEDHASLLNKRLSEESRQILSNRLNVQGDVPNSGVVETVMEMDGKTYIKEHNNMKIVEITPERKSSAAGGISALAARIENGLQGSYENYGEMEGRRGFEAYNDGLSAGGMALQAAAPWTGPAAPILGGLGTTLSGMAAGFRTIDDIERYGVVEGSKNGVIRVGVMLANYGLVKSVPNGATGQPILDAGAKTAVGVTTDQLTEEVIDEVSEENITE